MAGSFVKLYGSILRSSVWLEDHSTVRVWITLLALADPEGFVEGSAPGLAHQARVTLGELTAALAVLTAPDPHSKSPEMEGRRVLEVDGGWQLVNARKYRDMRTPEQVKTAERVRRWRARKRQETATGGVTVTEVTREGEGEEEGESDRGTTSVGASTQVVGDACPNPGGPGSDRPPAIPPNVENATEAPRSTNGTPPGHGHHPGGDRLPTGRKTAVSTELTLAPPPASEPGGPVFPCRGPGPGRWSPPARLVREWCETFPTIDVPYQIGRALTWVKANPGKKKTARGMEKFLLRWLDQEEDRARKGLPPRSGAAEPKGFQGIREFFNEQGDA